MEQGEFLLPSKSKFSNLFKTHFLLRDFVESGIIDNIIKLLEKHLQPTLNIMLKRQPQFPLSPSFSKCLQQIIQNKTLLVKTFNYLTDILNNPDQGILF